MSRKVRVVVVVTTAAALTTGVAVGAQAATKYTRTTITKTTTSSKSAVANPTTGVVNPMANPMGGRHHEDGQEGPRGGRGMGADDAHRTAEQALIASTLGIDVATLQSKLAAGNSLATIAGDKKAALITALVAFETKEIDAAVTAGKITAAQATTMKADLTARVTAKVESVRGPKGHGMEPGMGKGGHGRGHGMMGGAPALPKANS